MFGATLVVFFLPFNIQPWMSKVVINLTPRVMGPPSKFTLCSSTISDFGPRSKAFSCYKSMRKSMSFFPMHVRFLFGKRQVYSLSIHTRCFCFCLTVQLAKSSFSKKRGIFGIVFCFFNWVEYSFQATICIVQLETEIMRFKTIKHFEILTFTELTFC